MILCSCTSIFCMFVLSQNICNIIYSPDGGAIVHQLLCSVASSSQRTARPDGPDPGGPNMTWSWQLFSTKLAWLHNHTLSISSQTRWGIHFGHLQLDHVIIRQCWMSHLWRMLLFANIKGRETWKKKGKTWELELSLSPQEVPTDSIRVHLLTLLTPNVVSTQLLFIIYIQTRLCLEHGIMIQYLCFTIFWVQTSLRK